jgi:hypothetical protein
LSVLHAVMSLVVLSAPMAEVWPFQGKRLPDGTVEYTYDLTALKLQTGFADAVGVAGEAAVRAFLRGLPRQVVVTVSPTPLLLRAGAGLESAPLEPSFAATKEGPLAIEDPLGRAPTPKLLAPLDPRFPKTLLGVEAPLSMARRIEDAALAAVELDTQWMSRGLWEVVAERAVTRWRRGVGDTREGAGLLAARLLAATSCRDLRRLPVSVAADRELQLEVQAELSRLAQDPDGSVAPMPWAAQAQLRCAWLSLRALSRPFETSRAGTAAVLVFFDIVLGDRKLSALYEKVRQRRARFLGRVGETPLEPWKAAMGASPASSLEALNDFIERLPIRNREPPGVLEWPQTPFSKFRHALTGAEREAATDELVQAIRDGRIVPSSERGWPEAREAAMAAVITESSSDVHSDLSWRSRLSSAFAALQGWHLATEARPELKSLADDVERAELLVRLNVPPFIELEPLPKAYEAQARSLASLGEALAQENLTGLRGLFPDGRRAEVPLGAEVKRLSELLQGMATLARLERVEGPAAEKARRFVNAFRFQADLSRDVRFTFVSELADESTRSHAAVGGVLRRELKVSFVRPPRVETNADPKAFVVNTDVEQHYAVPVLVTAGALAPSSVPWVDATAFRVRLQAVQRDALRLESALTDVLMQDAGVR